MTTYSAKIKETKMTTYSAKPKEIEKTWIVIDAENLVVGRAASIIALRLRGKHKPTYTPHMDCGDHVVVINADKVHLTGKKRTDKIFYWHTNHPGGIKQRTMEEILDGSFPERVLTKAVERMITRNPLGREQMRHLHVYAGAEHPHGGQQPQLVDVGSLNSKNTKRS